MTATVLREREQSTGGALTDDRYTWWYDRPTDWSKPTHILYISGWCVDVRGRAILAIRAKLRGQYIPANIGIEREDVQAACPNVVTARTSGFAVAVPLPPGASELTLQVRDVDGIWSDLDHRSVFGDLNAQQSLPAGELIFFHAPSGLNARLRSWVHLRHGPWADGTRVVISGWCFANSGPELQAIRARVGQRVTNARFGIVRRDVALHHGNRPGSLHSGFLVSASIPRGKHQLLLEAKSDGRRWEPFFETSVHRSFFGRRVLSGEAEIYRRWIQRYERLTRADRQAIRRHITTFKHRPRFSILLPVFNPERRWLERAINSVRTQFYPYWELCISDDASSDSRVLRMVRRHARADDRIRFVGSETRRGIAGNSNAALALATGDFVALLDHDDELAPTALYFAAAELERYPDLELIYTDEDKIDERGIRHSPYFKPEWNPDLFLAQNYISHLTFLRADLVRQVSGFRSAFDGSQDYDLFLRCIGRIEADRIKRIPQVLYHWRVSAQSTAADTEAKPYAQNAAVAAVQEHVVSKHGGAFVEPREFGIYQRVRYPLPTPEPFVSIIIPSRDRAGLLEKCIDSILHVSAYKNFEVIVVDNGSREEETHALYRILSQERQIRIVKADIPFNFSRLINIGASQARGNIFLLLNNDVEAANEEWLAELVSQACRPEVGAVGARLWYPNGQLQHGGVILGAGGIASHVEGIRRDDPGYFARQHLSQDFCAVTAACMALRREVFQNLGGFDETNLPVTFNDVDFCLRVRQAGWRVVYTPYAELIHHESVSRGVEDTLEKQRRFAGESEFMLNRWSELIRDDPAYNPNLSLGEERFALAFPPRGTRPWDNRTPVED